MKTFHINFAYNDCSMQRLHKRLVRHNVNELFVPQSQSIDQNKKKDSVYSYQIDAYSSAIYPNPVTGNNSAQLTD